MTTEYKYQYDDNRIQIPKKVRNVQSTYQQSGLMRRSIRFVPLRQINGITKAVWELAGLLGI